METDPPSNLCLSHSSHTMQHHKIIHNAPNIPSQTFRTFTRNGICVFTKIRYYQSFLRSSQNQIAKIWQSTGPTRALRVSFSGTRSQLGKLNRSQNSYHMRTIPINSVSMTCLTWNKSVVAKVLTARALSNMAHGLCTLQPKA